jgi:hypothetical protein
LRTIVEFRRHALHNQILAYQQRLPVLYHGTRFHNAILNSGWLLRPLLGDKCVSFSRQPSVALYMATLERDDDEGVGRVLVIDREKLAARHRIYPRCNAFEFREEAEEAVWEDVRLHKGIVLASFQV